MLLGIESGKNILRRLANRLVSQPTGLADFDVVANRLRNKRPRCVHKPERPFGSFSRQTPIENYNGLNLQIITGTPSGETVGDMKRYNFNMRYFKPPDWKVMLGRNLYVITNDGIVYDSETCLAVRETMRSWFRDISTHHIFRSPRKLPPRRIEGVSISLASHDCGSPYHFLVEAISRLALIRESVAEYDHVIVSGPSTRWRIEWLVAAGVDEKKIVWLDQYPHLLCDELIFTGDMIDDLQPTRHLVRLLRELFNVSDPVDAPGRALWLSRRTAASRRLSWEQRLLEDIPELEPVDPAQMSPLECISTFTNARLVVGPHGAAFTNIIFCRPGFHCIELSPESGWVAPNAIRPTYSRLAHVSGAESVAVALCDFESMPAEPVFQAIVAAIRGKLGCP
jgi:hypothetical protein